MSNSNLDQKTLIWLYSTVFITGSAVMILELLGTRLIAPFYGNSLYVWSALISVTMIALALGYYLGGQWADRSHGSGLSFIIGLAAFFSMLIPLEVRPVLELTDRLGLRLGALMSSLLLFIPPLGALGMTGPLAIKLAAKKLTTLGNTAGSIYAISTIGSVSGTLILGFFLFPTFGSKQILISTGLTLLALSLMIKGIEKNHKTGRNPSWAFWLLISAGLGIGSLQLVKTGNPATAEIGNEFNVKSSTESLYGWVKVIDQPAKDLRILTSDASAIGAGTISNGRTRLIYQDIVGLLPALHGSIKKALIIGLGAGHMAGMLQQNQPSMIVDTLEIDPQVAKAASDYFGFKTNGKSVIGDARYEIRHLSGAYDLIIHDCFTGGSEPAHLLTTETLAQLKSLLSPTGILALNFVGFANQHQNLALRSVGKTMQQVFPEINTFISEPDKDFNDFIFLATNQALPINSSQLSNNQKNWLNQRVIKLDFSTGLELTDNFNPLEYLQLEKSEYYRRFILEWLGPALLLD